MTAHRQSPAERKLARSARRAERRGQPKPLVTGQPLPVNPARLALVLHNVPGPSVPEFNTRGTYLDQPFTCQDCGVAQLWTASQQKWWIEVARGDVWTQASRCRPCPWRERERRAEARRVHLAGLAAKTAGA